MLKLRGFVAQGMDGQKKAITPLTYSYPAGSYTFTAEEPGWHRFVLWGPGGGNNSAAGTGSGSGAFVLADRQLVTGQTVELSVAGGVRSVTADPTSTTVTFPWGEVLSAQGGYPALHATFPMVGGTATGNTSLGDILIDGSTGVGGTGTGTAGGGTGGGPGGSGVSAAGGTGAPGYGAYRGGRGGDAGADNPGAPGGGPGFCTSALIAGADGLVLIHQIRIRR